jgi:hypothetical protein
MPSPAKELEVEQDLEDEEEDDGDDDDDDEDDDDDDEEEEVCFILPKNRKIIDHSRVILVHQERVHVKMMVQLMKMMMIFEWNSKLQHYPANRQLPNVNDVVVIIHLKINNLKQVVINKVTVVLFLMQTIILILLLINKNGNDLLLNDFNYVEKRKINF